MPKVSIIVPAYNAANFIGATLTSILAQTFTDFECFIIDDGSTDTTVEVVRSFTDPRIKLIQQENSGGPAKPRNVGLKHSRGDYIFIFDADDIMVPEKVAASVKALDSYPEADMLFSNFGAIGEQGDIVTSNFLAEYHSFWRLIEGRSQASGVYFLTASDLYPTLIHINYIGTSSVALRASKIKESHRFDESLSNADDYLFWATFLKSHNALYVDSSLHYYRIQSGSISNQSYLKRGPSRIQAIKKVKADCESEALQKVLSYKLAKEYAAMAYTYKKSGRYEEQKAYSLKSLEIKLSINAIKLLIQSVLYRYLP